MSQLRALRTRFLPCAARSTSAPGASDGNSDSRSPGAAALSTSRSQRTVPYSRLPEFQAEELPRLEEDVPLEERSSDLPGEHRLSEHELTASFVLLVHEDQTGQISMHW